MKHITKRPNLKLTLSTTDKFFEISAWMVIVAIWLNAITLYIQISSKIPLPSYASEERDPYWDNLTIFIVPAMATAIFAGLTILNRYPHVFNKQVNMTQYKTIKKYTSVTRIIRHVRLYVVIVFAFLNNQLIGNTQNSHQMNLWFFLFMMVLMTVLAVYIRITGNYRARP